MGDDLLTLGVGIGSNCTFMELKSRRDQRDLGSLLCSNCTFMELKFVSVVRYLDKSRVLIVPLWN